jgi:hypothetical protein
MVAATSATVRNVTSERLPPVGCPAMVAPTSGADGCPLR